MWRTLIGTLIGESGLVKCVARVRVAVNSNTTHFTCKSVIPTDKLSVETFLLWWLKHGRLKEAFGSAVVLKKERHWFDSVTRQPELQWFQLHHLVKVDDKLYHRRASLIQDTKVWQLPVLLNLRKNVHAFCRHVEICTGFPVKHSDVALLQPSIIPMFVYCCTYSC